MSILEKILETKKAECLALEKTEAELRSKLGSLPSPANFVRAILSHPAPAIIAEVKKASPSKGVILENFNHLEIAKNYQLNGAACLSVLTDKDYFQGNIEYLREISSEVELPTLRKDFIIHPLQIVEARVSGAAAVLLITAALETRKLADLIKETLRLNLDALVEVHNQEELERTFQALELVSLEGAVADLSDRVILGINNRNLNTFETSLDVTKTLLSDNKDYLSELNLAVISESGIFEPTDIKELEAAGARGFLIGEALMRDSSLLQKLIEESQEQNQNS